MADSLMLVFTNAAGGNDAAFNEWYGERHLDDILKVPGVVAAQRYDLAPMAASHDTAPSAQLPASTHRYLTIYELDGEPGAVLDEFLSRAGTDRMPLSDTLDVSTVSIATWIANGPRRVAG